MLEKKNSERRRDNRSTITDDNLIHNRIKVKSRSNRLTAKVIRQYSKVALVSERRNDPSAWR